MLQRFVAATLISCGRPNVLPRVTETESSEEALLGWKRSVAGGVVVPMLRRLLGRGLVERRHLTLALNAARRRHRKPARRGECPRRSENGSSCSPVSFAQTRSARASGSRPRCRGEPLMGSELRLRRIRSDPQDARHTWEFPNGVTVIVGASGGGKSQLLNLIRIGFGMDVLSGQGGEPGRRRRHARHRDPGDPIQVTRRFSVNTVEVLRALMTQFKRSPSTQS